jgi:hypothetical protein
MLSHDEDRHLRAIEQWFEESDPAFTRMLRDYEPPERRRQRSAGRIAVDITGGLLFLIGAVAATAILMVFGVLVLAVGACLHLAARD